MLRSGATQVVRPIARRSGQVRGNASSHAPPSGSAASMQTEETFMTPMWRNTILFGVVGYATYYLDRRYAASHDGFGYFTSLIDYWRPREGLWSERNAKQFDLHREMADTRLVIHSADRPLLRQINYPGALDHGAPWGRRAEAQVDTSKVEVQRRDEVANA